MHRMRSFIILLLSHSCLPNPQGNWKCPQENINTKARTQLGEPTKANSWMECAAKCANDRLCELWTWVKHTGGAYARNCALMSAAQNTVQDGNVISGVKACQGSYAEKNIIRPTEHAEIIYRPDYNPTVTSRPPVTIKTISKPRDCIEKNFTITNPKQITMRNGVLTWEQCSEECRKKSGCTYWTWMAKTAPREALKCFFHVKTNNEFPWREVPITKKDIHAISGKPGAIDCQAQAESFNSQAGVSVTTMFMVLYSTVVVLLLLAVCVYNIHSYVKRGKSS